MDISPETRGAAATPPLALEGPVQSHHGTPALTQGPQSPRNGAQLGACTRPVDVRDSGGRPLPPPDTLASAGDFLCTM
ncbi:bcl-2-binding component 3 [Piliocolobus tephrosceles]|uniref:bcl-2-binding component 3 n=1 Tax=Piliocolobus tephrosceles TaxID=591936 RepID=UPI000C295BAF|nr:bcl-2-binding component 3 [Piliocolobus tephrosceles]